MSPIDASALRRDHAGTGTSVRPPNPTQILPAPQAHAKAAGHGQPPPVLAHTALDTEAGAAAWLRGLAGSQAFEAAVRAAARHGTSPHEEFLATGALSRAQYARALADALRVDCAEHLEVPPDESDPIDCPQTAWIETRDGACAAVEATAFPPAAVARHVRYLQAHSAHCALAPADVFREARERASRTAMADAAVHSLRRAHSDSSAASGWRTWQVLLPITIVGLFVGGALVVPSAAVAAFSALVALPFLAITVLRLLALREVLRRGQAQPQRHSVPPSALPHYSILVPLFREQDVIPDLVAALNAIDYPRTKLEVLLLVESIDLETQAALLQSRLPPHFRIIEVPDCAPRTKPKALNYALNFATGDLLVVFDAEDRPQPSQLRHAAEVFARAPVDLGCIQARLNIYNPGQSWLSRQFTIEYSALFDATLPMLEHMRFPVPLGGTSNHFRRETLLALGSWDPFNVTEDADLGIRLARQGYRTLVLPSTTWEEAPTTFQVWLRQRTRWIKGWMQTWLVHTRRPKQLRRDLGLTATIGLHATLGGLIGSALAQPLFYALAIHQAVSGELFVPPETTFATAMMVICWGNLASGFAASMLVGALSAWRRGRRRLALEALLMPIYWLLISVAAYRALYQLVHEPYLWEKTPHGAARRGRPKRRRPGGPPLRSGNLPSSPARPSSPP